MADRSTIARPYARAAFGEALSKKRLGPWSDALNTGAAVVTDERVHNLLDNPTVTPGQLAQLIIEIAGGLDDEGRKFLDHVLQNAQIMSALIEGLLSYHRLNERPISKSCSLPSGRRRKMSRRWCLASLPTCGRGETRRWSN